MAHKTLVGGTAYEISGGKTLVGGTAYSIAGGKTLVGGTAYDIGFGPSTVLNNNSPATIQAVAQAGQATNYWAVGDTIGITLNGTVGILTFSNETYYAFIIGFDHNSSIEGSNTIHFQFGKTSAGVDIDFVDSDVADSGSSAGFRMNTSRTSTGGWKSSYMRNTICPAFLAVMPTAWQNIIAACTKYSDNTGGGSNTASDVTATSDKIWLLSEYEVHGACSAANSAEQNSQKQYDYYANGKSKVKYKHNSTKNSCQWWLRSVRGDGTRNFCVVSAFGEAGNNGAYYSLGFAPCFMVG